jgi:hypothetical protein
VQEKQLKQLRNPCITTRDVYRKAELAPPSPSDFELPFGGKLSADNRWVKMARVIPWSEFESEYAENFPERNGCTSFHHLGWRWGINH